LAVDARGEMELLSIQTPVLETGSYDLSTVTPGILLNIHHCFCNTYYYLLQ